MRVVFFLLILFLNLLFAKEDISENFDFKITSSKHDLYMGESFVLNVEFKYKKSLRISYLTFEKPNFENFWFKQLDNSKEYQDEEFIFNRLSLLMTPLKAGHIKINPLIMLVELIDTKALSEFSLSSNLIKTKKVKSNSIILDIKPLPKNIKLVGEFSIKSSIDKKQINQGEAISFKIKIQGKGNVDDISNIKLDLEDAVIYENKPVIKKSIENNEIVGSYEKVFSILPNKDITIPSINIKYFNKKTQKVEVLKTSKYELKINNKQSSEFPQIKLQKQEKIKKEIKVVNKSSIEDKVIYFVLGIIFTISFLLIYFYFINRKNKKLYNATLVKKIKQLKNKNEILKVLAVYWGIDKVLDGMILKLEKSENLKEKKDIIKRVKELKL